MVDDADTLTRAPAPTTLLVQAVAADGQSRELSRSPLPGGEIDIGELPQDEVISVAATGFDGAGTARVWGQTPFFQWGALRSEALPLFLQRTGEMARMPTPPQEALGSPPVTTWAGRYLIAAGERRVFLYDLAFFRWTRIDVPRTARSLVANGGRLLLIDEAGATNVAVDGTDATDVRAPEGGSFAEVAGGDVLSGTDGTQWIVGATRLTNGPTSRILRVDAEGRLSFVNLNAARLGAAAVWVVGRGLVVVGGNATAPGAEIVAPGATMATSLPFPPRDAPGAGAAAVEGTRIVIAGGELQPRVIDLACVNACAWDAFGSPLAAVPSRTRAFAMARDRVWTWSELPGAPDTAAVCAAGGVEPVRTKVERRGARAVRLPNGSLAVVGGDVTPAPVEAYAVPR